MSQDSSNRLASLQNKRVLLGITGGIAAYKAPDVARRLQEQGADVRVVMSRGACEFITPLTLQAVTGNRVHTDLLDADAETAMGHIELARWGDVIVVAPATADAMARIAAGRADDLLGTLLSASDAPVLLAPAMNQAMWRDAATQAHRQQLAERGVHLVGPAAGEQACGDTGLGRMSEAADICAATAALFETTVWSGKRLLITAGPTREAIDPVRYLSNHSSGKMGFALAEAAAEAGAAVTLVAGPVDLPTPARVTRIDVSSAAEMLAACEQRIAASDVFVGTAAVADFRPANPAENKIKKRDDENDMALQLVKNPDILATMAASKADRPDLLCIGFAAETNDVEANARAKIERKQLDMIIANDVSRSDIGFGSDDNELLLITPASSTTLPKASKQQLARSLIAQIADLLFDR